MIRDQDLPMVTPSYNGRPWAKREVKNLFNLRVSRFGTGPVLARPGQRYILRQNDRDLPPQ